MRSYRKRLIAATAMLGILSMTGYAVAQEGVLGPASGKTVRQTLTAKVNPTVLPKGKKTPGTLAVRIHTATEPGAARPPRMSTATVFLDKALTIFTKGLAVCPNNRIQNTDEDAARRACSPAIVGKGKANGIVAFPDQGPINAPADVTIFNGVPRGNNPVFLIHAYTTVPVPTTFIVPGVYQRINKGPYGWQLNFRVPFIAGGSGSLEWFATRVGKRYRFRGRPVSYGYGTCLTGRLRMQVNFTYQVIDEQGRPSGNLKNNQRFQQRCRG